MQADHRRIEETTGASVERKEDCVRMINNRLRPRPPKMHEMRQGEPSTQPEGLNPRSAP
jgi:hypothetical protein